MTRLALIVALALLAGCSTFSGGNRTTVKRTFVNADGRTDELKVRVRSSAGPFGGKLDAPEQAAEVESIDDGSLVLTLKQSFGTANTSRQADVAIRGIGAAEAIAPVVADAVVRALTYQPADAGRLTIRGVDQ